MNDNEPVQRVVTQVDYVRLTHMLNQLPAQAADELEDVEEVLAGSKVVNPARVAPDVVTMNSQVLLSDSVGGEPYALTLCYPPQADVARGKISVLAPAGTSLLGVRAGSIATWRTPDGSERRANVLAVLVQPEAMGSDA